jgi:hypothetical protein
MLNYPPPFFLPGSMRSKERSPRSGLAAVTSHALQILWCIYGILVSQAWATRRNRLSHFSLPTPQIFSWEGGFTCYRLQPTLSTLGRTIFLCRAHESLMWLKSHLQQHRTSTYAPARSQACQYMLSNSKKSACRQDGYCVSWRCDAVGSLTG